jgi:ABC-type dipeptide/oligopeptide/nickel transport system permease component
MGTTVFYGSFLVLMVLLVDVLYTFADPRVQLQETRG